MRVGQIDLQIPSAHQIAETTWRVISSFQDGNACLFSAGRAISRGADNSKFVPHSGGLLSMTWALCFNCGEVKFGAICPCPKCDVNSTGDMNLDIAFSDHNMSKGTLEDFGKVVAAIHKQSDDAELCFWTFIRYVSINHSSILGVDLKPNVAQKCDALLSRVSLPTVTVTPSQSKLAKDQAQSSEKTPWWKFWRRTPNDTADQR